MTQNINSTYFQPFVLYSAAALLYVAVAFGVDFLFRAIEKVMESPPRGRVARALTGRKRRRIQALVDSLAPAEGAG